MDIRSSTLLLKIYTSSDLSSLLLKLYTKYSTIVYVKSGRVMTDGFRELEKDSESMKEVSQYGEIESRRDRRLGWLEE